MDTSDTDMTTTGGDNTPLDTSREGSSTPIPKDNRHQQKASLASKRNDLQASQVKDMIRRNKYLLGLTELFSHFIEDVEEPTKKGRGRPRKDAAMDIDDESGDAPTSSRRHRMTEQAEDAQLIRVEKEAKGITNHFDTSPAYVKNGSMRDYQIQGLNWLISLYENGINGILADEMGLGKTLQVISFLGYLKHFVGVPGPHLVVVPKSTLHNWKSEFSKWVPDFNVFLFHGSKPERADMVRDTLLPQKFEICITSYETCLAEAVHFRKLSWQYIVIDEAHRIKNENSKLSETLRLFPSKNRLLITGTPLQNNLHELWALLNFLLPDVFKSSEQFDAWFSSKGEGEKDGMVRQLRKVLEPFLLRRVKSQVEHSLLPKIETNLYVGMSPMQRLWYQRILEKDIEAINGAVGGKKEGKTRLLNIVMQLRKCSNHPYLFDGAEPGPPYTTDEHLVRNSEKMRVLDRLLKWCQARGSRVLLFSQMSRVLDILEDYALFRGWGYCRIDGSTNHEDRIAAIDEYNRPGSDKFLFLLTTRAGGLGINLVTADVVILFDSDWNPQVDLQAMDRAHRIGQTKQVYVYRLITRDAIEEKVLEKAAQKLRLDQLVIQEGRAAGGVGTGASSKDELLSMIQHGARKILSQAGDRDSQAGRGEEEEEDLDIEQILREGAEKTRELNDKYNKLGFDALQQRTTEGVGSAYEWQGERWDGQRKRGPGDDGADGDYDAHHGLGGLGGGGLGLGGIGGMQWLQPAKRERKANYVVDDYYREALKAGKGGGGAGHGAGHTGGAEARQPKQPTIHDFQFFPARYRELQDRENRWALKQREWKVPLPEYVEERKAGKGRDDAEGGGENEVAERAEREAASLPRREQEREEEQRLIDEETPLTEEEREEKERLGGDGFGDWNRRDLHGFIRGCEKCGRGDVEGIVREMGGLKTAAEVIAYGKVFWKRNKEVEGHERMLAQIERGEAKLAKQAQTQARLEKKLSLYQVPEMQLKLHYGVNKVKLWTEEEDRFLLCRLVALGFGSEDVYERIRSEIRRAKEFRFDWFLKSRTTVEIGRRCQTLVGLVEKEQS